MMSCSPGTALLCWLLMAVLLAVPPAQAGWAHPADGPIPAPAPRPGRSATPVAPVPRIAFRPVSSAVADRMEFVVLLPARPVRIRVHVELSGQSLAEAWQRTLHKAFAFFDRDKNGVLSPAEVSTIYSDTGLALMLQNGFYQPSPKDVPSIEVLDRNGDGVVSFEEFAAYYKKSSAYVLRALPAPPEDSSSTYQTKWIFHFLDTDHDGKLSREELQATESLLRKFDRDEDECLSLQELNAAFRQAMPDYDPTKTPGNDKPKTTETAPFVKAYPLNQIPETVIDQLIRTYDANKDQRLSRDESGLDPETFTKLDVNGDGQLSLAELNAWRTGPPDLEVRLCLASPRGRAVAQLLTAPEVVKRRGFVCQAVDPAKLLIHHGVYSIECSVSAMAAANPDLQSKKQFASFFTQTAGKKGFIAEDDLGGPSALQLQFLRVLFDAMDADANGKVTREEFDAYFDLQDEFREVSLGLAPSVRTPSLFQLLDQNHDGRLSVRELRSAWQRLIVLEPPGSQFLTRDAIKPSVAIRLVEAAQQNPAYSMQNANASLSEAPVSTRGPLWFRKMDRNGDGDVSRNEFLGTREEFDRIDTDHDGLISVEEAEAYDRKLSSSQPPSTKPVEKKPH